MVTVTVSGHTTAVTVRAAAPIIEPVIRRAAVFLFVSMTVTGCASTGAVPAPFPQPGASTGHPTTTRDPNPATVSDAGGYSIAGTALALRGSPYRNGGSDPTGFDCSGFVTYVFAQHAVNVPRSVSEQYRLGRSVAVDRLEPGDLVFFATVSRDASHVGIAIGGDEFVHAPSQRGEVRVERLSASYWASRFVGARRVI
jgi:cell wall-associated NlpC family hydrolase